MSKKYASSIIFSFVFLSNLGSTFVFEQAAIAKKHSSASSTGSSSSTHHHHAVVGHETHGPHHKHGVTAASAGRKGSTIAVEHHGRHHGKHDREVVHAAPKTRYAYSVSLFMPRPPDFEQTPFSSTVSDQITQSFEQGTADSYPARALVRAGLVHYHPLHGGIFWRREPVKYIIMHSTEPGVNQSAPRIIDSWSSMGIRHPGAQYVVDRDGAIYQAVDPELATVHINIFKTLPGINNDNSIGIEMCHTGRQDYPKPQRESVSKLVTYLQERYKIPDENIVTHRYAQQGDHTDPVNFDWDGFISDKNRLRTRAIAMRVNKINEEARHLPDFDQSTATIPAATTFLLQPHMEIKTTTLTPAGKDENGKRTSSIKTVTTTTVPIPSSAVLKTDPVGISRQLNRISPDTNSSVGRDSMRGPIEVDPDVVQQLSYPPTKLQSTKTPSAAATRPVGADTRDGVTKWSLQTVPQTTGDKDASPHVETMDMDPDGRGADAAPLPGAGIKPPENATTGESEGKNNHHKPEQQFFIHQ